jgi:hypothetical protein
MPILTVDAIVDLRGLTGEATNAVLVLGYNGDGDGGGGVFHRADDTATSDDGGVVIVPVEALRSWCWKRIVEGLVSVRWCGATGDGVTADQTSIQKALDFVAFGAAPYVNGHTVLIPPGKYLVEAAAGQAALVIKNGNVNLTGTGGPPHGSQLFLRGPGSGILIESDPTLDPVSNPAPSIARNSQVRNLALYGDPDSKPQDGIVVHAPGVLISDCYIATTARHGILIESAGEGGGPPLGVTTAPAGTTLNAQACRLWHVFFESCGDYASNGDPTQGAGLYMHGLDANGAVVVGTFAQSCNVGYVDGSLGGATWIGCYSEAGHVGFVGASAGSATFIGCSSEDSVQATFPGPIGTGSIATLAVGGSISAKDWGAPQRIGQLNAQLTFLRTTTPPLPAEPASYGAVIPGHEGFNSALDISYEDSTWSFAREPIAVAFPFHQASWRLFPSRQGNLVSSLDQSGAPFGWTDLANARGAGLPFLANPMMNSHRHWSYKETVDLQPGDNIVHLNGGMVDGGAALFLDDATAFWENAQSRLTVDLEFDSVARLASSDVRVVGYAFEPENPGRNAAAKLVNSGAEVATVTVVWHFETFVTNFDGSPG